MPNVANAEWNGNLKEGQGHFSAGSLEGEFTFKSRFEDGQAAGANPEQLIGAAHASCFSMALSNDLAQHGHEVESVKTTVEVTVKMVDEVPTITKAAIKTVGKVAGIDAAHFAEHAEQAKTDCIVSRALAGIDEITLETSFEG
ncbi:MAG TPA: OsmC family peroxiredoxin [Thermoleophilaceae bacterium]|nr:OsmC family peroxiredoxin [Thermoleophilaceae bacterium]